MTVRTAPEVLEPGGSPDFAVHGRLPGGSAKHLAASPALAIDGSRRSSKIITVLYCLQVRASVSLIIPRTVPAVSPCMDLVTLTTENQA